MRICNRVCIGLSFSLLTILQVALAELQEGGGQATTPATTAAEVSSPRDVCEEQEKIYTHFHCLIFNLFHAGCS